jgi:Bacterial regulatory proteins, tetR family
MPAPTRTPRSTWIDEGLRALAAGGPDAVRIDTLAKALGVTTGGFYWHLRRPPRAAGGDARHLGATQDRGGDRPRRARRRRPQDHGPASGALTFSRQLLPVDLAVRDWARRDRAVAKRLRRVDNRCMDYLRSQFASVTSDPDDVEARCLLAFSAAIGHHFIAAEHAGHSRAEALDLAARRLFT